MRPVLSLSLIVALCAGCGDTSTSKSEPAAPTAQARDAAPAQGEVKLARPEYRARATVLETTGKVVFNEKAAEKKLDVSTRIKRRKSRKIKVRAVQDYRP